MSMNGNGNGQGNGKVHEAAVAMNGSRIVSANGTSAPGPRVRRPVGVAIVGAGYWGPNITRNAMALEETEVRWVCDRDLDRARRVAGHQTSVRTTDDIDEVLCDDGVEAVAIVTPPATHAELALRCIEAGRHLLIEKPLADTLDAGTRIVEAARSRELVLQCDHTFCYTSAVQKMRELVARGELGTLTYYDSVRINLGLVQEEVDVFWDLAPHDLSILDYVLGDGREPVAVSAQGADPLGVGQACMGYLTLTFPDGLLAHFHVNWLSPTKVRTTILGGTQRMVLWNDLQPSQRVTVFESGVDVAERTKPGGEQRRRRVSYRTGDIFAPALDDSEALTRVLKEWASAIRLRRTPMTDGEAGLRVLRVLEAAQTSLATGAVPVSLEAGLAV